MDANVIAFNRYMQSVERQEMIDERVKEELNKRKQAATNKLARVVHPDFAEEFARILLLGWKDDLQEAKILAEELFMDDEDFRALDEDIYGIEDYLLKEDMDERDFGS